MKKSNLKKFAALLIIGAMQLSVLTGCGVNSNDSTKSSSTTTADETAIEQVFNHIEVDGKHVDFPFTLNDLGDDYEFANYVKMDDGLYGMDLEYKGNKIADAYVIANDKESIDRNSEIVEISSWDEAGYIGVNGIRFGSSSNDVKEKLYALKTYDNDDGSLIAVEYSDEDYYAYISVSDEQKVDWICFEIKY